MPPAPDDDVLTVLDGSHRSLLALLAATQDATDDELTPPACERLAAAVILHFVSAEVFLLPLVRTHIEGGGLIADAAVIDHRTTVDTLRRLEGVSHEPATVRPVLADTSAALRAHAAHRHGLMFPVLRRDCDPKVLTDWAATVAGLDALIPDGIAAAHGGGTGDGAGGDVTLVPGFLDRLRTYFTDCVVPTAS